MRSILPHLLFALGLAAATPFNLVLARDAQSTDHIIAQSARRLEHRPHGSNEALRLGDAYARKGRETGDASYFRLAERVLRDGAARHPMNSAIRRHLAYVLSLSHDFPQAAEEARRALELDPSNAEALGVLGDALLEQGDYSAAETAYDAMARQQASLASLSRLSGLRVLQGRDQEARTLLRRAIDLGTQAGEPTESVAWAQWQLGMEYFNIGRLRAAERWFQRSLATHPDYYRGHAGLALIRGAQGRYGSAARALERAMSTVPLPEYAVALGDLHTLMGRPVQAEESYALANQIARLEGGIYSRAHTMFLLDRGESAESALRWAEEDLRQRQDVYGHGVLAWALYKNGKALEAKSAMQKALRLGTRDARLYFQAGMIELALGDARTGRHLLRQALAINPYFHPQYAGLARRILRVRHV